MKKFLYAALRRCYDVMQILVATLRGAVYQQQRAAAYAALLPSLAATTFPLLYLQNSGATAASTSPKTAEAVATR